MTTTQGTNSSTEAMRKEFEAWATEQGLTLAEGRLGGYILADTTAAWKAWQAKSANNEALIKAALEVAAEKCKAIASDYYEKEFHRCPEMKTDAEAGASDCEEAIRQITPQQVMEKMK